MKRGTPDHPKVLELSELLGVRRPTAIGHLELLFHFTAQYAPEGNIGKYSNRRIAAALDWGGKTDASVDKCIDAFIDSGWIDRCKVNRLVTHDWAVHMDRVTRHRLKNSGRDPVATAARHPCGTPAVPLQQPCDTLAAPSDLPRHSVISKNTTQSNHEVSGKSCTQSEPYTSPLPTTTTTTTTTTPVACSSAALDVCDEIFKTILERHRGIYKKYPLRKGDIERQWGVALSERPDDPAGLAQLIDSGHLRACESEGWQNGYVEGLEKWIQRQGWTDLMPAKSQQSTLYSMEEQDRMIREYEAKRQQA